MKLRSHTAHNYSFRSRPDDLSSKWTETKENNDIEFETNELIEQLRIETNNKMVVLDVLSRKQMQSHDFKKNMVACSIPIKNSDNLQMTSILNEDPYIPEYVVYMVWSNKSSIMIEDARVVVDEIYSCSKTLLSKLTKILKKESYYNEYLDAITVKSNDFIIECFSKDITGFVAKLVDSAVIGLPGNVRDVKIQEIKGAKGIPSSMMTGLYIQVSHIDSDVIKNDGSLQDALDAASAHGYLPGLVSPSQIDCIECDGRDDKENTFIYGSKLWKRIALQNRRIINNNVNARNDSLNVFCRQFGAILRRHCNHLFLKPFLVHLQGVLMTGQVFFGPNGIKSRVEGQGFVFKQDKFTKNGTSHTKYLFDVSGDDVGDMKDEIASIWGKEYTESLKKRGSHKGWTFNIYRMKFEWDTYKQMADSYIRVCGKDTRGVMHYT